ncbi:MAG: putative rane protein [Labilithrix sp.]|nr:putative rane protein [Labilithrix sp.]
MTARAPAAHAQAGDTASALALFEEGKRLTAEGSYAEGCPKLEASYHLVQKLGTLLNLADCYEKAGKTASAWARFTEAATMADRASQQERAEFARAHAAALAPKLSRLAITIAAPAPEGLEIRRDGAVVDPAAFGSAVPVDPGVHVVEARAPQRKAWSQSVDVKTDAGQRTVAVPALEAEAAAAAPIAASIASRPIAPPASLDTTTSSGSAQRTWGLVIGGAGALGLAGGLVAGAIASSAYQRSNQNGGCVDDVCTSSGLERRDTAGTIAGVATGVFVGGLVLAGTGIVLYLTATPARASGQTAVSIGPGSLRIGSTW